MQTERRFIDARLCIDGIVTTAPETPVVGTQYLIGVGATGTFADKDNQIAYYSSKGWKYTVPSIGQLELFNLADLKFYRYESAGWVAYDVSSSKIVDPVINMVTSGNEEDLPATASVGDVYIAVDSGKVFTCAEADNWGTGVVASTGARYASTTDSKIYTSTGSAFSGMTLNDAQLFVCKNDENIYEYDADTTAFINLTNIADNPIYKKHTEVVAHTLTAAEVTAKAFVLPRLAELDCGVLVSVGGVIQTPATDFVVTNNAANTESTVSWTGKGLEDLGLVEGDIFVVSFSTVH